MLMNQSTMSRPAGTRVSGGGVIGYRLIVPISRRAGARHQDTATRAG